MYKNSAWDYHKLDNNCPFNMTLFVVTFKIAHMFGKFSLVGISLLKSLTWLQYLSLKGVSDKPRSTLLSSSTLFDVCLVDDIWCETFVLQWTQTSISTVTAETCFWWTENGTVQGVNQKVTIGVVRPQLEKQV